MGRANLIFWHHGGWMKGKREQKNRTPKGRSNTEPRPIDQVDLSRVEFHRHALALVPHPGDRGPGVALMVEDDRLRQVSRFCSCPVSKARTCQHLWSSQGSGSHSTTGTERHPFGRHSKRASGTVLQRFWLRGLIAPVNPSRSSSHRPRRALQKRTIEGHPGMAGS